MSDYGFKYSYELEIGDRIKRIFDNTIYTIRGFYSEEDSKQRYFEFDGFSAHKDIMNKMFETETFACNEGKKFKVYY